ncbi:Maf family protein [Dechloromonas denitrificans]|uniref:Maf family protein n=1 Tax=Dechloromonas denitrificans TaxID=281362 RepID=UPI001CF84DCB|nr:Maf family protein [Dechloromonas denitrificans]UCV03848.1 septum formation inhibitor Maf [Dechloromonas denitrificans]UCV08111.1 septum formation inhibitor Maf [Dechloromonas denitrificans]
MRLYLSSRSPRRRELLTQMGIAFDTIVFRDGLRSDSATDETPFSAEDPVIYVERVTRAKAEHGLKIVNERKLPLRPVLAADTTLEFDGQIIGKPVDMADAVSILRRLSGHTHRVLTGVALDHMGRTEYVLSRSEVRFRTLDEEEIRHYVLSGEPMDKAGAYGIQGRGGMFVEHLSGSFSGVMGLPVCETGELLKRFGWRF